MRFRLVLSMFVMILMWSGCRSSQEVPGADILMGMVYDENHQPCTEVKVVLDGERTVLTGIDGRFFFGGVTKGPHTLEVSKPGYYPLTVKFEFSSRNQVMYVQILSLVGLLKEVEKALEDRRFSDAEGLLQKAEEIDPSDPVLHYLYAILFYLRGDIPGAIKELEMLRETPEAKELVENTLEVLQHAHEER